MNPLGYPDYAIENGALTLPFNLGTPDVNGCFWYLDGEINGWDSPDTRVTMVPRMGDDPSADGEFAADLHYRGRTLTFKLSCSAPTQAKRELAWYFINQVLDLINSSGLFIANEGTPKQLVIQRTGNSAGGKLTLVQRGTSGPASSTPLLPIAEPGDATGLIYLLEADVEIYAADPRKYAVTPKHGVVAGSAVTLTNDGNTATQNMVLTINAGISNMRITVDIAIAGVGTMVLTVPTLPSSAPPALPFPSILHIDFYNKTIISGSGDNYYYLRDLRYPWLELPPGSHVLTLSGGLGDPDGSYVDYSDAWI